MSPKTKRIVGIVIGVLILVGLLLLLWLWYLGKQQQENPATSGSTTGNGSINASVPASGGQSSSSGGYATQVSVGPSTGPASSQTQSGTTGTSGSGSGSSGSGTYTPGSGSGIPSTGNGTYTPGTGGSGSGSGGSGNGSSNTGNGTSNPATTTAIGAVWIPNTGAPFTPTAINGVNSSNPTGSGNIFSPSTSVPSGNGSGSATAGLALGAAASVAACVPGLFTAGLVAAAPSIAAASAAQTQALGTAVQVTNPAEFLQLKQQTASDSSSAVKTNFLDCITRGLARVALQQITASVVNWINSGFNGSPTFVQNYQQFFENVANQAASAYIQGSSLSFLCSPFALQIKIAVAQSYANQTAAPSCTVTQVSNNINNFMNGDFSAGGWPALVSFTTVPTNNPFGAYMYAQAGLQSTVLNAQQQAQQNISPEGFINIQQVTNCPVQSDNGKAGTTNVALSSTANVSCPVGCTCQTTTPGHVIAASLDKALGTPTDQLNAAQDFDQIVSALMQQLLTKALQGGVSNLSGQNGYQSNFLTPEQQQAATAAQALLTQLQSDTTVAQQYGSVEQSEISDLQNAQSQLQTLVNCWTSAASSTTFSSAQQSQAGTNATAAQTEIASLQTQVDSYNSKITNANNTIALLEQLQSRILNASTLADVQSVQSDYATAQSNGLILTTNDLTAAQQDWTTLQSQTAGINQTTSTQLNQCYAFGN